MSSELEHYRSEATQVRAAMTGILDPLVLAQMCEVAEHFDKVADNLERSAAPVSVRDSNAYRREAERIRAAMSLLGDDIALKHLGEAARGYDLLAAEAEKRAPKRE